MKKRETKLIIMREWVPRENLLFCLTEVAAKLRSEREEASWSTNLEQQFAKVP
jgi:hypothetical protein